MTTVHLENGGRLYVYGDVSVRPSEEVHDEWVVSLLGPVARVSEAGMMHTLPHTRATTINRDEYPGHVLFFASRDAQVEPKDYLQIPAGVKTSWELTEEDAAVV